LVKGSVQVPHCHTVIESIGTASFLVFLQEKEI